MIPFTKKGPIMRPLGAGLGDVKIMPSEMDKMLADELMKQPGPIERSALNAEYERMKRDAALRASGVNATAAAQSGPPRFSLDDRGRVALEMAKTFMAIPGMLVHDENERAAIAVKNADALIKALGR